MKKLSSVCCLTSQSKQVILLVDGKKKPTCAHVRYVGDLFLLLNQLIERAEDAQQLLHLVCHGHAL